MDRGRTSVRSPLATYSNHSTSYNSPTTAASLSSYSSHITSYTSKGNLYPYRGNGFSSNENIRRNNYGDSKNPQVPPTFLRIHDLPAADRDRAKK